MAKPLGKSPTAWRVARILPKLNKIMKEEKTA